MWRQAAPNTVLIIEGHRELQTFTLDFTCRTYFLGLLRRFTLLWVKFHYPNFGAERVLHPIGRRFQPDHVHLQGWGGLPKNSVLAALLRAEVECCWSYRNDLMCSSVPTCGTELGLYVTFPVSWVRLAILVDAHNKRTLR